MNMLLDQKNSRNTSTSGGKKRAIQIHLQESSSLTVLQKESYTEPAIKTRSVSPGLDVSSEGKTKQDDLYVSSSLAVVARQARQQP